MTWGELCGGLATGEGVGGALQGVPPRSRRSQQLPQERAHRVAGAFGVLLCATGTEARPQHPVPFRPCLRSLPDVRTLAAADNVCAAPDAGM